MEQIRAYAASRRTSDLVLAPCFKKPERSKLHNLAADLKLEHTTVGVEADAQLVVHKWRPLTCFTAAVGMDAIGSTVAKDVAPPPPPAAPARRASRGASQRPAEPATPARPDASWAAGDLALVPKSTWPDYTCSEGDGWLVKVVKTKGAGASTEVVVHFVRARTRDDRPFEDVRLLASALRPPPEGAAAAAAGAAGAHEVVRGGVVASTSTRCSGRQIRRRSSRRRDRPAQRAAAAPARCRCCGRRRRRWRRARHAARPARRRPHGRRGAAEAA